MPYHISLFVWCHINHSCGSMFLKNINTLLVCRITTATCDWKHNTGRRDVFVTTDGLEQKTHKQQQDNITTASRWLITWSETVFQSHRLCVSVSRNTGTLLNTCCGGDTQKTDDPLLNKPSEYLISRLTRPYINTQQSGDRDSRPVYLQEPEVSVCDQ